MHTQQTGRTTRGRWFTQVVSTVAVAVCAVQAVGTNPAMAYPAGSLDTSFAVPTGKTTHDFGGHDAAQEVLVQGDGKIVAVGGSIGTTSRFALARYNADGTPDPGFGSVGFTTNALSGNAWASSAALDSSGNIVVAGTATTGTNEDFVVARFKSNGFLDTTFHSPLGYVVTDFGGPWDEARDLAIQADGKIVVVGNGGPGTSSDVALARYTTAGWLDPSFGTCNCGTERTGFPGQSEIGSAVAIQPSNGAIVVVGTTNSGPSDSLVLRYNSNGTNDWVFGFVTTSFGNNHEGYLDVIVDPGNNYILAAGTTDANSNGDFAMARYLPTGALDMSFNGTGKVVTDMGGPSDTIYGILRTGKLIVAVGGTSTLGGDFAVARYGYSLGQLDASFGLAGKVTTDFPGADTAFAGALDKESCAAVAAGSSAGNFALARYRLCT